MTDFADDLAVLDQEHDPSQVKFSEKAPDGNYQARLDICRIGRSRNERLQTFMRFEIVHGEHEGRVLDKFAGMETRENLDYLAKDIWSILGEKVAFKWQEVETLFPKMIDMVCEVRAVTDKESGIQNVFIQRKVTKINGKPSGKLKDTKLPPSSSRPDDDIPF